MRRRWTDLNLTHMTVMASGQYGSVVPWFYLWDEPNTLRDRLGELRDAKIIAHLWCLNGETLAAWTRIGITPPAVWSAVLPTLAGLVPAVSVGPEMNDFLSPVQQHDYPRRLRQLLPTALNLVHFTRKRSHGAHQLSGHPGGPLPAAWKPYRDAQGTETAGFQDYWASQSDVDGLYYNAGYEDMNAARAGDQKPLRDDLGDVSVRLTGADVPGVSRPGYAGQFRKVLIAGEFAAEHILRGRETYADGEVYRAIARSVPGVAGYGD